MRQIEQIRQESPKNSDQSDMAWTALFTAFLSLSSPQAGATDCGMKLIKLLNEMRARERAASAGQKLPSSAAAARPAPRAPQSLNPLDPMAQRLWNDTRVTTAIDSDTLHRFVNREIEPASVPLSVSPGLLPTEKSPAVFLWNTNGQEKLGIGSGRQPGPFREVTDPDMKRRLRATIEDWKKTQSAEFRVTSSMAALDRQITEEAEAFRLETQNFGKLRKMMAGKTDYIAKMDRTRAQELEKHYVQMEQSMTRLSFEHLGQARNHRWLAEEARRAGDARLAASHRETAEIHFRKAKLAADGSKDAGEILATIRGKRANPERFRDPAEAEPTDFEAERLGQREYRKDLKEKQRATEPGEQGR